MSILDKLTAIYAPHVCVGCGAEGTALCNNCFADLPRPAAHCYRCASPSLRGRTCRACRLEGSLLVSVNAAVPYDGAAKELVVGLKFGRMMAAADDMGRHLAQLYAGALPSDALIVPVPTARKRVRARGYDQATLIARSFARYSGLQYAPLLVRFGSQEQKGADRLQRQEQLAGVYRIAGRPGLPAGAKVVLVDDVMTTGSTLEEAGRTLKAGGAAAVAALVFARA